MGRFSFSELLFAPLEVMLCPGLEVSGDGVTTVIQINSQVGIPWGEHEPDAIVVLFLVLTDCLFKASPGAGVVHLGRFARVWGDRHFLGLGTCWAVLLLPADPLG